MPNTSRNETLARIHAMDMEDGKNEYFEVQKRNEEKLARKRAVKQARVFRFLLARRNKILDQLYGAAPAMEHPAILGEDYALIEESLLTLAEDIKSYVLRASEKDVRKFYRKVRLTEYERTMIFANGLMG